MIVQWVRDLDRAIRSQALSLVNPVGGRDIEVRLAVEELSESQAISRRVAHGLGMPVGELPEFRIVKRSIDARRGKVEVAYRVRIDSSPEGDLGAPHPREVDPKRRVLIVGDGPAGLFCAYELARAGIASTVIDRGKMVQPRRRDLAAIQRRGAVPEDSNYCFGEGGAGTYSDGKLYTRSTRRGSVRDVLEILVRHGAPADILVDARPHIGSNRLPKVVTALREQLTDVGVEFRFESRVVGFVVERRGTAPRVTGVRLASGDELGGDAIVLATGHSARDVYQLLYEAGAKLEWKPFAVGVRIEHPQPLINRIQYGVHSAHPLLPAASYRLAQTIEDRGVFSFCMCPGGWIVPSTTDRDAVVLNGMSLSKRNSPFANSGIVVAVEPHDLEQAGYAAPLGGLLFQRRLEHGAFLAGGGKLQAPATRLTDFQSKRASSTVPETSYVPGVHAGDVADVLDGASVLLSRKLRAGLAAFGRRMPGFLTEEAVLVAVESRTSSPVRVVRNETLEAARHAGLYPCGEGAGAAGGIMSAALDGMAVAHKIQAVFARTVAAS